LRAFSWEGRFAPFPGETDNSREKPMKRRKWITLTLLIVFFVGLSVLLYPAISSYWNSKKQSRVVENYDAKLESLTPEDYSEIFDAADEYNARLAALDFPLNDYAALSDEYTAALNASGDGVMGYIDIDKLQLELPIYHTTDDSVLSHAVGHLEGSSLPVGGESTHCVLSAHRGLPSATLFTYLDRLEVGDTFRITVLDRAMIYEVDQIKTVQPDDASELLITEGEDYCTLLTCTPYGINTHRLLVRGHRVDSEDLRKLVVGSEAYVVDKLIVTPIVALPILLILILYVCFMPVKRKPAQGDPFEEPPEETQTRKGRKKEK
jgi:sortase A